MSNLTSTTGDALSRLIQLHAGRHDVRLTWVGNGATDLVALISAYATQALMSKHLWNGLRELMQMPEMRQLPEAIQVHVTSVILQAQTLMELETEESAQRRAQKDKLRGTT